MTEAATRRFDAELAGQSRAWAGRVEAAYETAVVAAADGAGPRLTLLAAGRALVPWSVALPAGHPLPAVGEPLRLAGGRLGWGDFSLALVGPGVALTLPPAVAPVSREALARQLAGLDLPERTRALLGRAEVPGSTDGRLQRRLATLLARLCRAVVEGGDAVGDIPAAVARLAGLGPGLTPSGDDLLVGVAAATRRLAAAGALPPAALQELATALHRLPPGATSPAAREMLAHAAAGAFPEPLPPLVAALGTDETSPRTLALLVARVLELGSWSGCDLLAGVLGLTAAWAVSRSPASTGTARPATMVR